MMLADCEKACCWTIIRDGRYVGDSRYVHMRDFLSSHVPRSSFTTFPSVYGAVSLTSCADVSSYPSMYCTMRPFFDQPNQLRVLSDISEPPSILMILGGSVAGSFETLHTRKSPSDVCVASISVFCFDDEPCQASPVIGEGPRAVLRVCRIVKGRRVAIKIEPLRYLKCVSQWTISNLTLHQHRGEQRTQ